MNDSIPGCRVASAAAIVLALAACSGGGGAAAQGGGNAQIAGFVPQSAGVPAVPAGVAGGAIAQPLPEPLIALGTPAAERDLTAPIINDSGSYKNGAIIVGTDTVNGYGVEGITDGSGAGLYGHSASNSATSYGVYGVSPGAAGVYGNDSGSGSGVLGVAAKGSGVLGETSFPSKSDTAWSGKAGVLGEDLSTDGGAYDAGVAGTTANGSGVIGVQNGVGGYGVQGDSEGDGGVAVYGRDTAPTSTGFGAIIGQSNYNAAISAITYSGSQPALYADTYHTGSGLSIETKSDIGTTMSLDWQGNMILLGNLIVDGKISSSTTPVANCGTSCSAPLISTAAGAQVERVGDAQLAGGTAYVKIDPSFAKQLDLSRGYHVFVTPDGDSQGWLYVAEKDAGGFTIRESHHGTSNVPFEYRIVATPHQASLPLPVQTRVPGQTLSR